MMKEKAFYCKCRNRSYDLHETGGFWKLYKLNEKWPIRNKKIKKNWYNNFLEHFPEKQIF